MNRALGLASQDSMKPLQAGSEAPLKPEVAWSSTRGESRHSHNSVGADGHARGLKL